MLLAYHIYSLYICMYMTVRTRSTLGIYYHAQLPECAPPDRSTHSSCMLIAMQYTAGCWILRAKAGAYTLPPGCRSRISTSQSVELTTGVLATTLVQFTGAYCPTMRLPRVILDDTDANGVVSVVDYFIHKMRFPVRTWLASAETYCSVGGTAFGCAEHAVDMLARS